MSRAIISCNTTQQIDFSSLSSTSSNSDITNLESLYNDNSSQLAYLKALNINESQIDTSDPGALFAQLNSQIKGSNLSAQDIASLNQYYLNVFLGNVDKQNFLYILGKGDAKQLIK